MKKIITIIVIGLVIVGGFVWWKNKNTIQISNQPIKVGVAVDLSGYAANWGESEVKAIKLAYDEYKDKINQPIDFVIENTKGDNVGTVNAVKKLIEIDGVEAIIGPTWGDSFQGGLPMAENAKVVMISPSAAIETLQDKHKFSYFFSTWWPQDSEIKTLIDHMSVTGIGRLALVNDEDPFNIQIVDKLAETIKLSYKNISVVNRNTVPIGTKDFRTLILKIKNNKSDAVFVQLQDTSLMGPFMKQLKEQNVNIKVYATPDAENTDNITKFPGAYDGILYAFPSYGQDPNFDLLLTKFKTKFGDNASRGPSFVNAYNAATMLFEVIKDGARTGTEIRDALNKVHIVGIGTKDLSFTNLGQLQNVTFIMKTIKNNKFEEVN